MKDVRLQTRRHFSAEEKIRIVLDGLRGEVSIAELCRKEGIAQSLFSKWSKEFMEAGKGTKAKPKQVNTGYGMKSAEEFLRLEAYRPAMVREGEQVIELPAIQALWQHRFL